MRQRLLVSIFAAVSCASCLRAEVTLPSLFSDHAVLQRGQPIHVWGTATAQETVEVRFHQQAASATADAWGRWELWLQPESAGGPYLLTARGAQSSAVIERKDILVGDVWIASGQSNMEFPLAGFPNAPLLHSEEEIAHATQPKLRLLFQKPDPSDIVHEDTDATWTLCTPDTARHFSAVAYFFGREIATQENVPVGLIDISLGGTPVQSWISLDAIASARLNSVMLDGARVAREQGRAESLKAQLAAEDAAARAAGRPLPQHPKVPNDHFGSWAPASMFNAVIAPYTRYNIEGVLWYQGEADATAERAPNYAQTLSALILDWRQQWGIGPFPFLFAQISSFGDNNSTWPMVRDQQRQVLDTVPNTSMAVTLDVGLRDNVHPPDKQTVAHRLALLARAHVYGEAVDAESPRPVRATLESGAARVWLQHATGLHPVQVSPEDFEIAGEDSHFVPASVTLKDGLLLVRSSSIPEPRFIRYAWKGTVTNFLLNQASLPMGTFALQVR